MAALEGPAAEAVGGHPVAMDQMTGRSFLSARCETSSWDCRGRCSRGWKRREAVSCQDGRVEEHRRPLAREGEQMGRRAHLTRWLRTS